MTDDAPRYSASISMHLIDSTGVRHALSHVGPESVVIASKGAVALGPALVSVSVDGEVVKRDVCVMRVDDGVVWF